LAKEAGSLKLVVRNMDDKSGTDTDRVTVKQLLEGRDPKQQKDDIAKAEPGDFKRDQDGPPPITQPEPKPEIKPDPQPEVKPQPKAPPLKKMTVTVRNGPDVRLHHYWVDPDDNVVPNPQQYFEQFEQNPAPASGPAPSKDDKKVGPDV